MIGYIIREALSRIRASRHIVFTTTIIVAIILLLLGIFVMSFYNFYRFVQDLKKDLQVVVYLKNLSPGEVKQVEEELHQFKEIKDIVYVSKNEALVTLTREMNGIHSLINTLKINPLPDSFKIVLTEEARNQKSIKSLVDKLRKINGIEDITYGKEFIENLDVLVSTLKIVGIIIGGIIVFVVLFVISSTIKLTIFARRDEIEIMKYVGATDRYIRLPFMIEGGILGFLGALLSIGLLFLIYKLLNFNLLHVYGKFTQQGFMFVPYGIIILFIVSGILLGAMGSWISAGRYLSIVIIIFLCFHPGGSVYAKSSTGLHKIERKIKENQNKLHHIHKKIKEKKRAKRKIIKEVKQVKKRIALDTNILKNKQKMLMKLSLKIKENEHKIESTRKNKERMMNQIINKKLEVGRLVKGIYKSHIWHATGMGVILASVDYNESLTRSKYEELLIRAANRIIDNLNKEIHIMEKDLFLLNRQYNSLLAEKASLEREKSRIKKEIRRERLRLASIQEKRAEYEREIKKLARSSRALRRLIRIYEKKKKILASRGKGFQNERGRLLWPLRGRVVSAFGRQRHPEFKDVYIFKKGIEIASKHDEEVRSVYDGVVAYADWLQGYGLIIIMDHGGGFYSIYAHMSRLLVSKGEKVRKGQIIALAGNKGDKQFSKELYFEIRHNGKPENPLIWLAKK